MDEDEQLATARADDELPPKPAAHSSGPPSSGAPSEHAQRLARWFLGRVTGQRARNEWDAVVEGTWNHALSLPVREVLPPEQVNRLVESYLQPDRLTDLVLPVISAIIPAVVRQLREDSTPLGRWVPDGARGAIEHAVCRPNIVHEDWIRALFRQRAVEAVMADTLYRGIRDFSTLMPRLMLSLMPVSRFSKLGTAGAFGKRVIEELEKRIEPEIKTFLKGGTKLALERAADFAVEHSDDEAALAFRRNVVHFVLSKAPAFHVHGLTPAFLRELEPVVEQIARHAATRSETRTLARDAMMQVADTHGDKTVGQLLRELGVREQPPLREWAALAWPLVLAVWNGPAARTWVDGLVQELLDEHERLARGAGEGEPR